LENKKEKVKKEWRIREVIMVENFLHLVAGTKPQMQEENKYYKYLQLMYHIQTSKTRKTKKKD
jgi:hypothetical protein